MNICTDCSHFRRVEYTGYVCKHPDVQRIVDYVTGASITILCQAVRKDNSPDCPLFKPKEGTTK